MVILAATLWICRRNGVTRNYTSEPIALMLAAYAAFVSVFCWMLFAPGRRALKESPALFLCAAVTLLPPCIIAFHLMPPDSPLRGWLTLGTFMFSSIAVLSPVPDEFFAIPRERHTYLRPISGGIFAGIDYQRDSTDFQQLRVRTPDRRAQIKPQPEEPVVPRDPWADPFADTGSAPTRPGQSAIKSPPPEKERDRNSLAPPNDSRDDAAPAVRSIIRVADHPFAPTHPEKVERPADNGTQILNQITAAQFDTTSVSAMDGGSSPALQPHRDEQSLEDPGSPPDSASGSSHVTTSELTLDRMKDEFGGEMIEGTIRVSFEPGQKKAHLHIPFDPPLPGVPDVECEAVGDHPLRVKAPVRQTYGIRIEARRSDAAEQVDTEVGFSAIYTPADRRF